MYARDVDRPRLRQYVARARQIVELALIEPIKYVPGYGNYNATGLSPAVKGKCDADGFIAHVLEINRYREKGRSYDFNRLDVWQEAARLANEKDFIWVETPYIGSVMLQPKIPDGVIAIVTAFEHDNGRITRVTGIDCNRVVGKWGGNPITERDLTDELHEDTKFIVKMSDALTYP